MSVLNKPVTTLEWCNNNPVDPTSLQNAIIDPSVGKKDSGFLRLEKPPRQDVNWFQNLSGLWNGYLETLTDGAGIINATHYDLDAGNTGAQNITALGLALAVGKKLFIPAGTYEVDGNISIPDGSHIFAIPGSVIIRSSGVTDWDVKNKTIVFESIIFEDNGPNIQILCGHSTDAGFSIFEKCTFKPTAASITAILNLNPGVAADSSGLVQITNCTFIQGNAVTNLSTETDCPRIIATGNDFGNGDIELESPSIAVRLFKGNRFDGSNITLAGGNIHIENNFFDSTPSTLILTGTVSGRFANNEGLSVPSGFSTSPSRFEYENNKDQSGIQEDNTEAINGIRYEGSFNGTVYTTGTTTKINFSISRSVQMAHDSSYTFDTIEDGTGVFTIKGISKRETRIECLINLPSTSPTGNFQAYLKVNGVNTKNLVKSLVNSANTILTLTTTILFSKSDTFTVEIENQTGGNITAGGSMNSMDSKIIVEGF